ncbi:FtsK/SpoIIIE domain-containing protein [Leucobacter triazinivorans]|uniref:FHA domain-containing protein n=1 Tax=Leucobacter triazinivorans TaxID=1784719 RepID=A0A4P6KF29_9MICO|nr:FtsK/SpoIIIE domain-containing protein [Leucobacter triazinivorans]QBE48548.1 FHA domain-containing protein [Leucobacter triazinivorans]
MKLRVTLALPRGEWRDVSLSCDITTTVADTARTLIRAGVSGDPQLERIALDRIAPVTLLARAQSDSARVLLDPAAPVGASGLQSGWIVQPVLEFGDHGTAQRAVDVAGYVEVLSGRHRDALFSLVAGANPIGRDRECRIHLGDDSVSRRHAVIDVGSEVVIRDLGSANGTRVDGEAVQAHRITRVCTATLGEVSLRITPGPPPTGPPGLSHRVMHTRVPRVAPRFPQSERELPAPPAPSAPSRIPVLAMLAPMLMGGAMYAMTQSPMSLMMVAFSPLMMIGSWLDGRASRRRRLKRELSRFEESMSAEQAELAELREREIEVRAAETPTLPEVMAAISERDGLLWTRRPEHRSFLEVRFGDGTLPSRTAVTLPPRGETERAQWELLRRIEERFRDVAPVPVLERFDRCGSIGVAGDRLWAEGMARSLALQLVGLHSPAELTLACFADSERTEEWGWLKWLPHVDAVTSPLPVWQLADDAASSTRLLIALEGLLEARRASAGSRKTVRSHLDVRTRNDDEQSEAIDGLPVTPAVIVLVLECRLVDQSRLIALAEDGPDSGIHLIWVARERARLPAACRTFVELGQAEGRVGFVRTGTVVPLRRIEFIEAPRALELARRLAPVEDTSAKVLDESDLPRSVHLRELHDADLLGGAPPIVHAWAASGTLTAQWTPGAEREQIALAAVVGQGSEGPAAIDLRTHGPHALVGGTTGAGKSEFLQTWIMSMAARVSPERLTFLLVDYKGGAAFAECTELPHTVGLVTDLSPHLVRRALTSLRAELRYREELLARHGAKDLISMERRSDPAAPPVLVIVIDEFAALANEVPEFVDGVIDVAQRGRSLGLHLIMATQRPAGVIKDSLRANSNLRVALRMADELDSRDVIGVDDAAYFDPETPGRGAIKIGPGRVSHFQTGYLGGRAASVVPETRIDVRSLRFTEGEPWDIPPEPGPARSERGEPPRDIEELRDGIVEAARIAGLASPRRPWLDALPETLDLQALRDRTDGPGFGGAVGGTDGSAAIGLRDEPAAQAQRPVCIDLEEAGSIAFIGAGGTGKTSALITLAASLSMGARGQPLAMYAIDAAGGALDALAPLPTVGALAPLSDIELVGRILQRMLDLIAERGPRYAAARAGGLAAYRRTSGGEREPRAVLLIDGFGAFRQATEGLGGPSSPFQMLGEIMMTGRAVGVHVVLTADRPAAIPAAMSASLQQHYVFRLAGPHDYSHLGVAGEVLDEAPPGRALLAGEPDEIQIALLGGAQNLAGQARELEQLAITLRHGGVQQAAEVRNAPDRVPLSELATDSGGRPVYGIDTRTFVPVGMRMSGLGVVSGPAGSGQSTAVRSCVEALSRWAAGRGEEVETVLLTLTGNGLRSAGRWDRVAHGAAEVQDLARQLVVALGGAPVAPASGLPGGAVGCPLGSRIGGPIGRPIADPAGDALAGAAETPEPLVFPRAGARGVIVVERPAEAEGTEALPVLVALAKAARRAEALVLFEFEQGTAGGIWELFTALKQPRWGIALQPDDAESQTLFRESFGRVKRADFPPGRGFAVEDGRVLPVQVALPDRVPGSGVF